MRRDGGEKAMRRMRGEKWFSAALKWLKTDIVILFAAAGYYLLLYLLNTTCLIKAVFGAECPCCGMTRAVLCLLSGDLNGYFAHNFMALPFGVCAYIFIHVSPATRRGRIAGVCICAVIAAATAVRFIILNF